MARDIRIPVHGRGGKSNSPFLVATLIAIFLLHITTVHAFYIPGFSIKSYRAEEPIPLFVNKVYSDNTELQYAYAELPFVCPPTRRKHGTSNLMSGSSVSLNLGEILRGDRITVSDYELFMGHNDGAHFLCSVTADRAAVESAIDIIRNGYVAEWIVDNLPGATQFVTVDRTKKYYAAGFKLGYEDNSVEEAEPRWFINNHVTLVIRYRLAPGKDGERGKSVIVGFEVYPKSIGLDNRNEAGLPKDVVHSRSGLELVRKDAKSTETASDAQGKDPEDDGTITIPYTYSVYFREEETIEWQNRWDLFFINQDDTSSVHWFAIVNSLVIVGLLAAVVAVILTRTIRGELQSSLDMTLEGATSRAKRSRSSRSKTSTNGLLDTLATDGSKLDTIEDNSDDDVVPDEITGWKLVHADVFRPPARGPLLASLVGSGTQVVFMSAGLIFLSCIGVLNPSFRGGFSSVGMGLFIFAGILSGYFSARLYKTFGGQEWRQNVVLTASLVPGMLFMTVFVINLFTWTQASSTALPFGTLIALVLLWLLIQLPLVYAGSWYGYVRAGALDEPIKASAIPRQIPPQPWYLRNAQSVLIAGSVPFVVIFVEMLFVFQSVWQDKSGYYYMFGFLALISLLLVVTVMEVTIVSTYLLLCNENYHWYWSSFLTGSASALWIYVYSFYFFFTKLHITGFVSSLLFFGYTGMACALYGLTMGSIGFVTAYVFVRKIFGAVKVD